MRRGTSSEEWNAIHRQPYRLEREDRTRYESAGPGGHASAVDDAVDQPDRAAHGAHGTAPTGADGWDVGHAPRAMEARARLRRCATTPGSPLGATMGELAQAVDTLGQLTTDIWTTSGDPDRAAGPAGDADHAEGGAGAADRGEGGAGLAGEHVDVVGDALVALGHLRTRLDACHLALLRGFDARKGHFADGAMTATSWYAGRAGIDHSAAARQGATARRLVGLPRLAAHLAAGDVTLAHVTAVTDRATPGRTRAITEAEDILADLAVTNPPAHVRHAVRHLIDAMDPTAPSPATTPPAATPCATCA